LFLVLGFEIEFFNAVTACDNDPRFLRVGGVYQHLVGHYSVSSRRQEGLQRAELFAARPKQTFGRTIVNP